MFTPPNLFGGTQKLDSVPFFRQFLSAWENIGNRFGGECGSVLQDGTRSLTAGPYSPISYRYQGGGGRADRDPRIRICTSLSHPCTGLFWNQFVYQKPCKESLLKLPNEARKQTQILGSGSVQKTDWEMQIKQGRIQTCLDPQNGKTRKRMVMDLDSWIRIHKSWLQIPGRRIRRYTTDPLYWILRPQIGGVWKGFFTRSATRMLWPWYISGSWHFAWSREYFR